MRQISLSLPWNPNSLDSMLEWARDADETGVVTAMVTAASGQLTERQLANWVRNHIAPHPKS